MSIADEIYRHSIKLPAEAARAVLDFIELLETRYGSRTEADRVEGECSDSPLFAALEKIGFVGCANTDGQPSPASWSRRLTSSSESR